MTVDILCQQVRITVRTRHGRKTADVRSDNMMYKICVFGEIGGYVLFGTVLFRLTVYPIE